MEEFKKLAHTVKGSVGAFGASRAQETAAECESKADSAGPHEARACLDKLSKELDSLRNALESIAAEIRS
jgi:HPt (histidine-containing phosphotransfer) domain-containing protein